MPSLDANITLSTDGYMRAVTTAVRTYDKKYYFFPVPTDEIQASGCSQNNGW